MQIDVHRINAQVAGADLADDGVEIRAVAIDIAARRMHRVRNRLHVAFEQPASVGIGDHHARHVGPKPRLQARQIDAAFGRCGNILDA